MKKVTFSILFTCIALYGFATTWTVSNNGFMFDPPLITIAEGDTVIFDIENIHTVLEVSQATWDANGNDPLNGGFSLPFGGGMLLPADLPAGTHYYVCQPHASMGMKGRIIVEESTAIQEILPSSITIFPNPADGKLHISVANTEFADEYDVEIVDMQGRQVFARQQFDIEVINEINLASFAKGMYLVKLFLRKSPDPVSSDVREQRREDWTRVYTAQIAVQ